MAGFLNISTIILILSSIVLLSVGFILYSLYSRPKPQIFPHFLQYIPEDKIKLSKSIGTVLVNYKNHYLKNNIEFDPTVLQLSLKNVGDMSLSNLVVFVSINAIPRKTLEHLNIDTSHIVFKKYIGKLNRNQRIIVPLLVIGFFRNVIIDFKLEGIRTDVRFKKRVTITDRKEFELED